MANYCIPVPAEYSPLASRTKAAALATASNWIFTFLVVEITPISIKNIQWKTYIYFSAFNFLFIPLIYFFYPETQNLSLEQIDKLFTGDKVKLHWSPSMGEVGDAVHRTNLRQRRAAQDEKTDHDMVENV